MKINKREDFFSDECYAVYIECINSHHWTGLAPLQMKNENLEYIFTILNGKFIRIDAYDQLVSQMKSKPPKPKPKGRNKTVKPLKRYFISIETYDIKKVIKHFESNRIDHGFISIQEIEGFKMQYIGGFSIDQMKW